MRKRIKDFIKYSLPFWMALAFVIWMGKSGCSHKEPETFSSNSLKTEIKKNEQARDSAKKEVSKTEVAQTEVKKTYRQRREDLGQRGTPCRDTILQIVQLCDTVIFVDSVLIGQLKQVIKLDSLTIDLQKQVIHADSLTIASLTKSVKKETRKKKFWRAATIVVSGIAGGLLLTR